MMAPPTEEDGMPRQIITTPNAPSSPLYSQGVKAGRRCSSQERPASTRVPATWPEPTIQAQTRQALANCEAILQAGGASLDDVVEVGVLLSIPATSPA